MLINPAERRWLAGLARGAGSRRWLAALARGAGSRRWLAALARGMRLTVAEAPSG